MSALNIRMSKRHLLKFMGAAAGAAVLAACGATPAAPATTTAPSAPTSAPEAPTTAAATTAPEATSAPSSGGASVQATPTPGGNVAVVEGGAVAETIEDGQKAYGSYDKATVPAVEILLWGPPGDETDPEIRAIKANVKAFNDAYPNIKTTYEPIQWSDIDTKVNAALAAKQGPDMVMEADREGEFARRAAIRDITEEVLPMDYIQGHKFYQVRPLDDGKLYWLHTCAMGPIIYANKKILDAAGVKVSDVPKTWDEFGKFAQQFVKNEGGQMSQAGFSFNGYARYIWNDMMYQQKAHVYNKKKSFINSQESVNAWQMLVDMYDKYKVNDRSFLNYDEAFGTGKSAFVQVWTWFGSTLEANYPDIEWVPVTYPTFTGTGPYGRFDYDGLVWMVTTLAQGDKLKAAWELFKFTYHNYQFMVDRAHNQGSIVTTEPHPDYPKMFADAAAKSELSQADRRAQSLAVLADQFKGGMVFPGEVAAPFDDMWHKMEDAILLNKQPIQDVLKEYEALYDEMLSKTNFWITPEA